MTKQPPVTRAADWPSWVIDAQRPATIRLSTPPAVLRRGSIIGARLAILAQIGARQGNPGSAIAPCGHQRTAGNGRLRLTQTSAARRANENDRFGQRDRVQKYRQSTQSCL